MRANAGVPAIVEPALRAGRTVVTVSAAALIEHMQVVDLARAHGGRIVLATGALLGFDAVRAAAKGTIHSVDMVTMKPPKSLVGAPYLETRGIDVSGLTEPLKVFEGSAREGAAGFPANVNVAAALALAGIGPDRTRLDHLGRPDQDPQHPHHQGRRRQRALRDDHRERAHPGKARHRQGHRPLRHRRPREPHQRAEGGDVRDPIRDLRMIWPRPSKETSLPTEPFARSVAAVATPFTEGDLAVDHAALAAHAHWLLGSGCDGLVLFGTTGEAVSLSAAERKAALEHLIADGVPATSIVVGTGGCALDDTVALTRHVAAQGCAGALVVPPFFYKGVSDDGVRASYDRLIAACDEELPPIFLYHIPQMSAVPIGPDLTGALIEAHGGKIAGYKDSAGDWANTAEILRRFPHLQVFVGSEVNMLGLPRGRRRRLDLGDDQRPAPGRRAPGRNWRNGGAALQATITAARETMDRYRPSVSSTKAVLSEIHAHPAWRTPRPPLLPLSEAERTALLADLRALNFEALA